ncbi:MAG: hypothetical protein HC836_46745 [Richelia sp. RM2_1_2]|nr:hypothetical protein [Richelia sp. RM2_1_2]
MAAAAKQQKFKEESRIGIVLVKPTEKGSSILINTRAKNGSGGSEVRTSVLPGARNKYCPVLDAAKNFPGCTRDEFKKIKEELDLPEKLTYEEFWTLDKLPQVTLTDKPFKLNKAVLSDYIKYLVLLHHPWVASSNKSIEPQHRYVMVDEEQEAREYVSKN